MGFLHYKPEAMSISEARRLLAGSTYFDYLHGRVMKIQIQGDILNPRLYDRDNGPGAAANVIRELRESGHELTPNSSDQAAA